MCKEIELPEEIKRIEDIESDIEQLGFKMDTWLRDNGWRNRCDFPDSCWRWCKKIKLRTDNEEVMVCVSKHDAINLEKELQY